MKDKLILSSLGHTWLLDIDGTIFKHNGYKLDGYDTVLPGVKEFFRRIPEDDVIILLTSREEKYRGITEDALKENGLRYDMMISNLPYGERILINDDKPSGLSMAHCIALERDAGMESEIVIKGDI